MKKNKNSINLFKELKKFSNNKNIFIEDAFSQDKISFSSFFKEVLKLKKKINLLSNKKVYLLQISNNINDLVLLTTFLVSRKKIILFPKKIKDNLELLKKYKLPISCVYYKNNKLKISIISNKKLLDTNFDILIMSSGSTGLSKLVKLKINESILNSKEMSKLFHFSKSTSHLMLMPIYHVNALFFSFLGSLISSQKLIISSSFVILDFWKIIEKYSINSVSLSPTLVKMLNKFKNQKIDNTTLKMVACASTFLSKIEYKNFKKNFGLFISQGYGLSEATNFSTIMPTKQNELKKLNKFFDKEKYISIGKCLKNHSIKLKKYENNTISREFIAKGKYLSNGYYNIHKSRPTKIETGDLGYFKKYKNQKYFFITGRKKEIIKYRDETVFPIDIEGILQKSFKYVNFFCFGFVYKDIDEIGCMINKADFNFSLKNTISKINKLQDYQYYPKFFFIGNINKYLTKTNKPRRNFISNLLSKKKSFKEIGENIYLI